jgi:hypothetical protein
MDPLRFTADGSDDDAKPRDSIGYIDQCRNHILGGSKVRRHYFHHDYAQEMRDAWRKLGNRLDQILNVIGERPDNVIPMRKS